MRYGKDMDSVIKLQPSSASSERQNDVVLRRHWDSTIPSWRFYKKWVVCLNSVLFTLGLLWSIWLLSHVQDQFVTTAVGGRGGIHLLQTTTPVNEQETCGNPTEVFQTLGLATMRVPDKATLSLLPTPQQHPVTIDGDISYDPKTNELCTIGWQGLSTRYGSSQLTTPLTNASDTEGSPSSTSTSWVQSILKGLFSSFAQTLSSFFSGVLSWAKSFGFMFVTPDALTYNQPVVIHLHTWMVGVVDSLLVLLLVVGGYHSLLGQNHLLKELAPRFILSGIAATGSLFFLTQCIEVQNQLCLGFQAALATAGIGDLSLPLGVINWATAPVYEVLTYLIDLLMSVILCIQMLVRIGLLDFLLIMSPLGFLCFALPHTIAWGRLWAQAFVSTLLLQFFQTVCIGLGSVLISSFGHSTYTVVSILVGIATLYIAFKLPTMLLSHVLHASVGSVHRDAGRAAQSVAEVTALAAV
jgi:hypothetical protein